MKTMKHGTARLVSMLLTLTMVLGLLPVSAFAAEAPAETVTVTVNFDTRAVGSAEALEDCAIKAPADATAEVPAGSTVYEALEAARAEGAFKPVYGAGFDGTPNGYVAGFNDIVSIQELCEKMGVEYSQDLLGMAGWMYTVNGADGMGIQVDKITEDTTISFRYATYSYWDGINNTMANPAWDFVDAYDGLKADLAAVEALDQTAYTEEEWTKVTAAATAGQETLAAVDQDGLLEAGMMLNYVAAKGTSIWGPDSVTDQLQTAVRNLNRAVNKILPPEKITVPADLVLTVGHSFPLNPVVLPEGALQDVTYEVILGGDAFTVSETGLVTPTKESSLCMVQIKAVEDPKVMANLMFKIEAYQPVTHEGAETMLNNLAASSVDASDEWTVMDMGAYRMAYPEGAKLNVEAMQKYVNYAVNSLTTGKVDEGKVFKAILALRSQGLDPADLTPYGLEGKVNAYELLATMELNTGAWNAPYSLEAFHAADPTHELYKEQAQPLLDALLKAQNEKGAWNEWGTVDTTANAIAALALYPEVEGVPAAIEKGLDYLSSIQDENGVFGAEPGVSWGKPNANSSAMVIIALAAAGVDLAHDARFIKNGSTAVDGLMTFALADGSGFGYTDNETADTMATEQAFRALIPAVKVLETGKACNVYDFSAAAVEPAIANGRCEHVDVDFVDESQVMTIADVPEQLIPVVDGRVVGKFIHEDGDLKLILDRDCDVELMFRPEVSYADVKDGDWFAGAVEFGTVREMFSGVGNAQFGPALSLNRAQTVTMLYGLENAETEAEAPFTDLTLNWYKAPVAWAVEKGITSGVSKTEFAPNAEITRQELAVMLYRYAEAQGADVTVEGSLEKFRDADTAAPWAVEALTWAVENHIMAGDDQGCLLPAATANRGQAAVMMESLVQALMLTVPA